MRLPRLTVLPLLVSLLLAWATAAPGQGDQAKIQQKDPGNPLVLNNLAAVMAKEQKYGEALNYLEQALPRARGYRVKVNRVCGGEGLCLAFRPAEAVYGDQELAPLVQLNLEMVKARLPAEK